MARDETLKTWVSDQLMSLVGYSKATVVQYVIGVASQAASPADVVEKLVEYFGWLPSSGETEAFAEEVFSRAPRKAAPVNLMEPKVSKKEEEEALPRQPMEFEDFLALRKLYPKKRDQKKLEEIWDDDDDDIEEEDEQDLSEGVVNLSEEEEEQIFLRYEKKLYEFTMKYYLEDNGVNLAKTKEDNGVTDGILSGSMCIVSPYRVEGERYNVALQRKRVTQALEKLSLEPWEQYLSA